MTTPNLSTMLANPVEFRRMTLGDRLDPWQRADFEALDPALQLVAGRPVTAGKPVLRAYLERPHGHSKTTDIAWMIAYALLAAVRPVSGVVAAGDTDQARIVRNVIASICAAYPWIGQILDVQRSMIINKQTGSECSIISSDAATSYGLLVDFVICDELTHWTDGNGETLWESLFSAAAKKPACMLIVISNAGLGKGSSWQWKVREAAREDQDWYFSRIDGPQASWISPSLLDEQRRFLPQQVFRRLWLNEWSDSAGDMLTREDIEAAVVDGLQPLYEAEPGWCYAGGLDLSTRRDHSALVIVAVHPQEQRMRLASVESWIPSPGKDIDLESILNSVLQAQWAFGPNILFGADPWQAELLMQRVRKQGVNIEPVHFVGRTLDSLATATLQVFTERRLKMFRDERLTDELSRLSIVEKSFGLKIQAPRSSAGGHCDRAMALSIGLLIAVEYSAGYQPPIPEYTGQTIYDL